MGNRSPCREVVALTFALAVEDTASLRALLQLCLTRGGYQVDVAAPGSSITAARSKFASYVPESRLGSAAGLYASISIIISRWKPSARDVSSMSA